MHSCTFLAHTSPTLNGTFVIQCYGRGNVVDLCNGIMFDFYLGLPHFHRYTILLLEEMMVQFTSVILEAQKHS